MKGKEEKMKEGRKAKEKKKKWHCVEKNTGQSERNPSGQHWKKSEQENK